MASRATETGRAKPRLTGERRVWPLGGYAPGGYMCKCRSCEAMFDGDKRATECLECAVIRSNAALAADLWRPIETAPKDGAVILVAHAKNGAMFTAWWESGAWIDGATDPWDEPIEYHPSHWMPLPSPPRAPLPSPHGT